MRPLLKYPLLAISLMWGMAVGGLWPQVIDIREEARKLGDSHQNHDVAHPGWSFPARIWSGAAPLDLPTPRLMENARLRHYEQVCPPEEPGEYCEKTGTVIPRGGYFPEGRQPAGFAGWKRPVALEPLLIGYLLGPDGEIREHLPLDKAPTHLIDAILAAEDQDFREHPGFNPIAFVRAGLANSRDGRYTQGASTLTMQMVKVLTQRNEKTPTRKIREIMMALSLDRHLGKDGILQMYLDAPYLGQSGSTSICGFEAAAQHYWGKRAEDLSLAEAATLAGILPAPGRYSPDVAPKLAKLRRDQVLRRMADMGYDVAKARAQPVEVDIHPPPETLYPPYMQATRSWLEDHLPAHVVYGAGLNVFTALDLVAQAQTETVLAEKIAYLEGIVGRRSEEPLQAAAALIDPYSGAMVAAYGGTQQSSTDFNRATQARRQPGSAFKPLVYALAFSRTDGDGMPLYTSGDTVPNMPRTFENTDGWRPRNISGKYSESVPLAQALTWSQNVATASLLEELGGPRYLVDFANRLGFDSRWLPEEMGLSLGQGEVTPVEMASFVATVINGGRRATGSPVVSATDAAGHVRVGAITPDRPVMTPEAAVLTREMMRLVVQYGTGGAIRGVNGIPGYSGEAIGKTGTTDKEYDLWFVGGTPYFAGALWVGYDQPTRIGGSSSEVAAPLWGWWMRGVHDSLPDQSFEGPEIEYKNICILTGKRAQPGCRGIVAPFLPGTAPSERSTECASIEDDGGYVSLWRRRQQGESTTPGPRVARRSRQAAATDAAPVTGRAATTTGPDL